MRSGICFLIVALFSVGVSSYADDSLAAYWPLDGTVDDLSGNGHHGVAVNGPVWSSEGFVDGCVSLDGVDDHLEIVGYQGITGTAGRTCGAWIKTSAAVYGNIISWGAEANGQKWMLRVESNGTLGVGVWGGYITTSAKVNDGQWHHVAAVLKDDGSPSVNEIQLYIDGVRQAAAASNSQPINTAAGQQVMIGAFLNNGVLSTCFKGNLDDVRIYDRAFSASDIAELLTDFEGDGDGTAANPFRISTPLQLQLIGSNPVMLNKHFVLVNDIDLSGVIYTNALIAPHTNPGSSTYNGSPFIGTFDGGYFSIRNLTIAGAEYVGLFGKIGEGGTVQNLRVENAAIEGDVIMGGLCGTNDGILVNCSVTGNLTGQGTVGGLCGVNNGVVFGCSAFTEITSQGSGGGLCGLNRYKGILTNCYASGAIAGPRNVGGLCGRNEGALVSCYATCAVPEVHYPASYNIGGLCGENVGGTFEDCFWDVEASGSSVATGYQDVDPAGTLGLTTFAMQQKAMYIFQGWDFVGESVNGEDDVWRTCIDGQDYPKLNWEFANGSYGDCDEIVELELPGSGTEADPYLISEPLHLYELGDLLDEAGTNFYPYPYPYPYLYVSLVNDIDMTGIRMNFPIGCFVGFFEGNGHAIQHLTIDCKQERHVGLFNSIGFIAPPSNVTASVIQNLHLGDASIVGGLETGTLAGNVESGSIIRNCSSTGSVHADGTDIRMESGWAGGLVGGLWGGSVENCTSACSVSTAQPWSFNSYAGGLIGKVQGTVSNCYANGSVLGYRAGGIAGAVYQYGGVISNYSTTSIDPDCRVGGGIAGRNEGGELSGCFWDTGTSGVSVGVGEGSATGVTGKSTADMQSAATFTDAGWDFLGEAANGENELWRMCADGVDYPRLSWEFARGGDFACGDGVDLADLQALADYWLSSTMFEPDAFNYACDANGDEQIDLQDFRVLSENWLR
jgi:hypothetical protein